MVAPVNICHKMEPKHHDARKAVFKYDQINILFVEQYRRDCVSPKHDDTEPLSFLRFSEMYMSVYVNSFF